MRRLFTVLLLAVFALGLSGCPKKVVKEEPASDDTPANPDPRPRPG